MRPALFYNPRLLCERLAITVNRRRRLSRLRCTPAANLKLGHLSSLELLELFSEHPPSVIYDIGANTGSWTILAKSVFPKSIVHAFEPYEPHIIQFRNAVGSLSDVNLHSVALGAENRSATLHVTSLSDASSLLSPTKGNSAELIEVGQISAREYRLDDFAAEHNLPWPDLLKLDVQGYEVEALKGARKCLKHAHAIISEVSFHAFYQGQCLFHDVVATCAHNGFELSALGTDTVLGRRLAQTDALFEKLNSS